MKVTRTYCAECKAETKFERKQANHILHLLLTWFTAGLWIIIWFIVGGGDAWRCAACGTKKIVHFSLRIFVLLIFIGLIVYGFIH